MGGIFRILILENEYLEILYCKSKLFMHSNYFYLI